MLFRSDIAGTESVKLALANGDTIVNTAISAGKSIADLLTEMKGKTVQANQVGLDAATRSALNNDFGRLRDQITSIITSASFSNTNLITSQAPNLAVLSSVDGSTITVSAQIMDIDTLGISTAVLNTSAGAVNALTAINTAVSLVANKLPHVWIVDQLKRVAFDIHHTSQNLNLDSFSLLNNLWNIRICYLERLDCNRRRGCRWRCLIAGGRNA